MQSFSELEKKNSRTNVTVSSLGHSGTGVLTVAGNDSTVKLSTEAFSHFKSDNNGWFDLSLKSARGENIFLHNALQSGSTSFGTDGRHFETTIFPNYVAFGAKHLSKSGHLTTIGFTMEGLESIFDYETIEQHFLYKTSPDILRKLKELRRDSKHYQRQYDFFRPQEVWILHHLPRVLQFRVHDRTYEIYITMQSTLSWTNPEIKFMPIAVINFDEPTTIDRAINHVWDWRRFFSQITMEQLRFQAIWARCKGRPRGYSSLYLPNLKQESPKTRRYLPHGSLAPLNGWKRRRVLGEVMQSWLTKQEERRVFRVNLEGVTSDMNEVATPDHVLSLCAGIESLAELDSASRYSKDDVTALVEGAKVAAKEAGISVQVSRLRGLLGLLRKENLPQRVRTLSAAIEEHLPSEYEIILGPTQKIRNARAHGSGGLERFMPSLSPTTHALAGMCVVWDQKTSGLPFEKLAQRLSAQGIVSEAIQNLRQSNTEYTSESS